MTELPLTRVDSIAKTGRVPGKLRVQVFVKLRAAGIEVTPLDFVPDLVAAWIMDIHQHAG